MRGKSTDDERRRLLADDVRRLAGLADFAVGEAALLEAPIPEGVAECVSIWRNWYSAIQVWRHGEDA
jgi:hypothetical protein